MWVVEHQVEERILKAEHARMMKLLDEQEEQLAEVMHEEIESVKREAKAQAEAELEAVRRQEAARTDEAKAQAKAELEAVRQQGLADVEAVRREMQAELDAQVKTQLRQTETGARQRETELEAKLRELEADARTHEAALKAQLAAEQLVVCVRPHSFDTTESAWNCLLHTLDAVGPHLVHGKSARPECTLTTWPG